MVGRWAVRFSRPFLGDTIRTLLKVSMPVEPSNKVIKSGSLPKVF